jgi:ribosome-binding protein aMBF1 (putative translation factor)
MDHQDWKPVVLRRELTTKEAIKKGQYTVEKKQQSGKTVNSQAKTDINMRKLEQDDDYKPPTVTHSLARQIQLAREGVLVDGKKMTQAQLAAKIQVKPIIIQQYENPNSGVTIESSVLQKINRALGVNLKKPPKPKVVAEEGKKESS